MSEFLHFIKRPTNDMLPPTALTSLSSSTFTFPKRSPISPNPHTNRTKLLGTILRNHPDKEFASITMEHEVNDLLTEDHQRLQTAGNVFNNIRRASFALGLGLGVVVARRIRAKEVRSVQRH